PLPAAARARWGCPRPAPAALPRRPRQRPRAPAPPSGAAASPGGLLELDSHRVRELSAERLLTVADPHEHRTAERLSTSDLDPIAERDALVGEIAEHLRIGVRDADEATPGAIRELVEAARRALVDLEPGRRDRIAVRIEPRVSEAGSDQLLEVLGDDVLEPLRLGMHPVPRPTALLRQAQLDQP